MLASTVTAPLLLRLVAGGMLVAFAPFTALVDLRPRWLRWLCANGWVLFVLLTLGLGLVRSVPRPYLWVSAVVFAYSLFLAWRATGNRRLLAVYGAAVVLSLGVVEAYHGRAFPFHRMNPEIRSEVLEVVDTETGNVVTERGYWRADALLGYSGSLAGARGSERDALRGRCSKQLTLSTVMAGGNLKPAVRRRPPRPSCWGTRSHSETG